LAPVFFAIIRLLKKVRHPRDRLPADCSVPAFHTVSLDD
jgi:hypothetical protein